jgi:hypothetical protein
MAYREGFSLRVSCTASSPLGSQTVKLNDSLVEWTNGRQNLVVSIVKKSSN